VFNVIVVAGAGVNMVTHTVHARNAEVPAVSAIFSENVEKDAQKSTLFINHFFLLIISSR
jgi:hypothetical protein